MSPKYYLFTFLMLLLSTPLFSQRTHVADQHRLNLRHSYAPVKKKLFSADAEHMLSSRTVSPVYPQKRNGSSRTNAVTPVQMGRASNAFTILSPLQNQVAANDSLNLVIFIHRQDVSVWGGGSGANGRLRYDLSIDAGFTFYTDAGVMNDVYTQPARYPNANIFHPGTGRNPFDSKIVYSSTTVNTTNDWDGHVHGLSEVGFKNTGITGTENYKFQGANTWIPGSLTRGLPGEYWQGEISYTNGNPSDTLFIYKGVYNNSTQDIDWNRYQSIYPNYANNHPDAPYVTGPNISFSPDGQTGWIGLLSDLAGVGGDSTIAPVLSYTTDGGVNWSNFMEVDLNAIPWVYDTLRSLWRDSLGNPAGTGRATTAFDFDLTVDAFGNPHFFTVIGNAGSTTAPDPEYSMASGLSMFAADISTTDFGQTWTIRYISPILTLRGEFGNLQDPIPMDNYPQASRSDDGQYIFFSWLDTDSILAGFNNTLNNSPDLRIAGIRMRDGWQTCFKHVSDGDLIWGGQLLFATMAPSVMYDNGSGYFQLPIVSVDMITNDQNQPCRFYYWGREACLHDYDFVDPQWLDLYYDNNMFCNNVIDSNEDPQPVKAINLSEPWPNPTHNSTTIRLELQTRQELSLDLVNVYGQTVVSLAHRTYAAGIHDLKLSTQTLAAGVYFVRLQSGTTTQTKKLIVVE